jgi:hypothetical protein
MILRLWLSIMFVSPGLIRAQGNLALVPAEDTSDGLAVKLVLDSLPGAEPAAIQWTLTYPAEEALSISAVAAGSALDAGKQIQCAGEPGTQSCLLTGMNATLIQNGVVAVIHWTPADRLTRSVFGLVNTLGSSSNGRNLGLTGLGAFVPAPGPPVLDALSCAPASLTAGEAGSCIVTLSNADGGTVSLVSNLASLNVPESVAVAAGSTTTVFGITAGDVSSDQLAGLTASLNNASQSTTIALLATPTVADLSCTPRVLSTGDSGLCTVMLSGRGGGIITVTGSVALMLPASVLAPRGDSAATFPVIAAAIPDTQAATLTASLNGGPDIAFNAVPPIVKVESLSGSPFSVSPASATAELTATGGAIPIDQTAVVVVSLNGSTGTAYIVLTQTP